eukprot:TRINITY_DN19050_c0_g1_i1.p1 TRINITY_DN19050_c0_g1~~TRINITY_DN19050_c0_g1_i1.p1  ORF type:complete len:685 (+),score=71.80 TRINITY_DN19050_c0_g1_i1:153-2207(+)
MSSKEVSSSYSSESTIPQTYICPITGNAMKNPVVVSGSGNIYEYEAISKWFKDNNTDPLTNIELKDKALIPLQWLQNDIQNFFESCEAPKTKSNSQREIQVDSSDTSKSKVTSFQQMKTNTEREIQVDNSNASQLRETQTGVKAGKVASQDASQSKETQFQKTIDKFGDQFPSQTKETQFQKTIDKFGDQFPNLFQHIANGNSIFTKIEVRKCIYDLQKHLSEIEAKLQQEKDTLKKIREQDESTDTSSKVRDIMKRVIELRDSRKQKQAQLQAKGDMQIMLQSLPSEGSIQNLFIKMKEIGIVPTCYVDKNSALIKAASKFEKAVFVLSAMIASILEREVQPTRLEVDIEEAHQLAKSQRNTLAKHLEEISDMAHTSSEILEAVQKHEEADTTFTYLKRSEAEIKQTYDAFVGCFKDFTISIGLVEPEAEENRTSIDEEYIKNPKTKDPENTDNKSSVIQSMTQKEFFDKLQSVESIAPNESCAILEIRIVGDSQIKINKSLTLKSLLISGSGTLTLSGKEKSIEVANCTFSGVGLVLKDFDIVQTSRVLAKHTNSNGIFIENVQNAIAYHCECIHNKVSGISFYKTKSVEMDSCNVNNNTYGGIEFNCIEKDVKMYRCQVKENEAFGIRFYQTTTASLDGCILAGNKYGDLVSRKHAYTQDLKLKTSDCTINKETTQNCTIM